MAATAPVPSERTLAALREAVQTCKACGLYRDATQAVLGDGDEGAEVMFVGEVPGDKEDLAGEPFVGPAGRVLDQAMERAGIDRRRVFVTNVVKHFKFEPRGKRRIHQKPNAEEIAACRPWLQAELEMTRPKVVVCLGATAAKALIGSKFRVTRDRGRWVESDLAPRVMGTVHPSSIIRAPDDEARHAAMEDFVRDLEVAAEAIAEL